MHVGLFDSVRRGVGTLTEELDPLRLYGRVVLGCFHQLEPAGDRGFESLLQLRVPNRPVVRERLVRLGERERPGRYGRRGARVGCAVTIALGCHRPWRGTRTSAVPAVA